MQEMTNREYLEDQDAEEPDDFIISLSTQVCLFHLEFIYQTIFCTYTLFTSFKRQCYYNCQVIIIICFMTHAFRVHATPDIVILVST